MTGITHANYKHFKTAYLKAKEDGREQFTFEGHPVLTSYAKYACEAYEMRYPNHVT